MTNDDKDLKPCPFCGNKIIVVTKSDCFYFKITCVYCLTTMTSKNPYKAWNTRSTPQQPSEPLKKLDEQAVSDELQLRYFKLMSPDVTESDAEIVANSLSKAICSKFGQPSEKKALSVEEIEKIIRNQEFNCTVHSAANDLAQTIHSAMPARKEVKWPEKIAIEDLPKGITSQGKMLWNQAIESCMQAYEEALPAQSLLDEAFINGKKESRQEIFEAFQRCVDRLSIGGNTANSFNSQINYIKSELFDGCIPAKREVRYPEKRQCTCLGSGECVSCIKNQAIDEFKKLNGG